MKSIGIDLIDMYRFSKIKNGDYQKWRHIFTKQEWQYAFKDIHSAEHLAGIFAAKEAAMKAYGVAGISNFLDWEVRHNKNSQPEIFFVSKPVKEMKTLTSISHEKNLAVAVVIILWTSKKSKKQFQN